MKYFFYFILIIITNIQISNEEIIFVFEHIRHGARSSVFIDKQYTDIYDIKWIGDGELTSVGMRMLYLIGVHIRTKYSNIINKNTSLKDLLVYSTDLNRTILSAECQLLGMFPPEKGEEISEYNMDKAYPPNQIPIEAKNELDKLGNISIPSKIRAVPLNFFHKEKKPYLLTEETDCPRTKYIKQKNFKKEDIGWFIKNFTEKYSDKLMQYFNITNKAIFEDYYFLLAVTDHFISSYIHKRTSLTEFEDLGINLEEYYYDCIKFKNISMFEIETTKEMGVMAASPVFKDILHYMDSIINSYKTKSQIQTPKFVLYSGHDYIIASVQLYLNQAFGVPCFYPGFAANQFFELHKQEGIDNKDLNENNFFVQYFFNGELELNVTYPEFKKKVKNLMWSMGQIIDFCRVEYYSFVDYLLYFSLFFSLVTIIVCMVKDNIGEKTKTNLYKNKYQIYKSYQIKDN